VERKFQRGFEADDAGVQIFNVGLLLGDRGVELFHLVVQLDGVGEGISHTLGESHRHPFLRVLASASMRASDSATRARVLSMARMVFFVSRMTCLAM